MSPRQRFVHLLKNQILKIDEAELDFGVYRLLNARRRSVLRYLDERLPALIEERLAALPGAPTEDEEARIFAFLDTFFARYWDDGDFIVRARRGRNAAYSVPYRGEDVLFHWATRGSHYVKSGEFLRSFAYTPDGGGQVRFEVVAADQERDNVKGAKRYFLPLAAVVEGARARFQFEYRPLAEAETRKYDKARRAAAADGEADDDAGGEGGTGARLQLAAGKTQQAILRAWLDRRDFAAAAVPDTLAGPQFERNVARFVRRQTSDFFVHPNLGPFLEGELDYALKNEFMQIWDRADGDALARERGKLKIARDIGQSIIAFLHQIEDFQARLFEKRKLVLGCEWLAVSSDLAARPGGAALVALAAANPAQVAQWKQWLGEALSTAPFPAPAETAAQGRALLERYPHLPIHTKNFDPTFKDDLLACYEDIDAALAGTLIHAENYAALRTLEPAYRDSVKCIYIDPPYNTIASEILYKNDFHQSSWLSLMAPRVATAKAFLESAAPFVVAIDDFELVNLCATLDSQRGERWVRDIVVVNHHPQGAGGTNVSRTHEYAVTLTERDAASLRLPLKGAGHEERPFMRSGTGDNNFRRAREKSFYAILVDPGTLEVKGVEPPPGRGNGAYPRAITEDGYKRVYPMGGDGSERVWRLSNESGRRAALAGKLKCSKSFTIYQVLDNEGKRGPISSNWVDKRYNAGTHGSNLLADVMGKAGRFSYPKSVHTVRDFVDAGTHSDDTGTILDFFAGSGTTAHAVINLNREDGGERKFILVEQGEYFDTVIVPRIAKVMTCPEWKDGRPRPGVAMQPAPGAEDEHWARRTLPLVKIVALERYEDSLDALQTREEGQARRAGLRRLLGEDEYLVRYWLDEEAAPLFDTRWLDRPFDLKLPILGPQGRGERPVDLGQTALALLGLRDKRAARLTRDDGKPLLLLEGIARDGAVHLLALRDVPAPEDFEADYRWLAEQVSARFGQPLSAYARVWANGDALFLGGENGASMDPELARVMLERDPHVAAA